MRLFFFRKLNGTSSKKEKRDLMKEVGVSLVVLLVSLVHICFLFSKEGELYSLELVNIYGIMRYVILLVIAGLYTKRLWVIQQLTWLGAIVPYWFGIFWMHYANLEKFKVMGIIFRRKFTIRELKLAAQERFGSSPYFNDFSQRFKWEERAEVFNYSREGLLDDIKEALRFYAEVFEFGDIWDMGPNHYQSYKVSLFFTGTLFLCRTIVWFYTFYIAEAPDSASEERQNVLQAACEIAGFMGAEISLFEERGKEVERNRVLEKKWFHDNEK